MKRELSLVLALALASTVVQAQMSTAYDSAYQALVDLKPLGTVARVRNLTLTRGSADLILDSGTVEILEPIADRTVGAVFSGSGHLRFSPPTAVERAELQRFEKKESLNEPFTSVFLLAADSSIEQLAATLSFSSNSAYSVGSEALRDATEYLADKKTRVFHTDVIRPFLNHQRAGLFMAHIIRDGNPLLLLVNPWAQEDVSLSRGDKIDGEKTYELMVQFSSRDPSGRSLTGERNDQVQVSGYQMDVRLPQTSLGDLNFVAAASLDVSVRPGAGRWASFDLYSDLVVDSARRGDSSSAFFKGKDSPIVWVDLGDHPNDTTAAIRLFYHGNLIDRYEDWFFVKSSIAWYPRSLDGRDKSRFDVTFQSPRSYRLVGVGRKTDSGTVRDMAVSRWVTQPTRNLAFNIGTFEQFTLQEPDVPDVTVLFSDAGHRALTRKIAAEENKRVDGAIILGRKGMDRAVAGDVSASLKFFADVYGPVAATRVYATEIPYPHAEAFSGMVELPWVTFQAPNSEGFDEILRSHEVAHQWWGLGVDYATYHDQWLSEGLAEFSGLWYLQTSQRKNEDYFRNLHQWRDALIIANGLAAEKRPGPIWLGERLELRKEPGHYDLIVYRKGAWVFHMLRILMMDLNTAREDLFKATMADFFQSYRGKRATTRDFQRVVEAHAGMSLDWFFDQWVYGTGIPKYTWAWTSRKTPEGKWRVHLRVAQDGVPPTFRSFVPVTIDVGGNRFARMRVEVTGAVTERDLPLVPFEPKNVTFNELDGVLADVHELK